MHYGCETRSLRVEDQRRLEVFDSDCLRRILGCRRLDRVRAPSFAVNSIFELCLRCFFSVDFIDSGMLPDVLPAESSASLSTPSPECIGVRSAAANSKRGRPS